MRNKFQPLRCWEWCFLEEEQKAKYCGDKCKLQYTMLPIGITKEQRNLSPEPKKAKPVKQAKPKEVKAPQSCPKCGKPLKKINKSWYCIGLGCNGRI